jgi:hypothetical protein
VLSEPLYTCSTLLLPFVGGKAVGRGWCNLRATILLLLACPAKGCTSMDANEGNIATLFCGPLNGSPIVSRMITAQVTCQAPSQLPQHKLNFVLVGTHAKPHSATAHPVYAVTWTVTCGFPTCVVKVDADLRELKAAPHINCRCYVRAAGA